MRVALGALATTGLETRVGPDVPAAVHAALVYYVGKLESGRGPARYPKFLSEQVQSGADMAEFEVDVDSRIEAALERRAGAEGTTVAELARHAVLVYLAELDLIGEPASAPKRHVHA
jgi:hypothetical protein